MLVRSLKILRSFDRLVIKTWYSNRILKQALDVMIVATPRNNRRFIEEFICSFFLYQKRGPRSQTSQSDSRSGACMLWALHNNEIAWWSTSTWLKRVKERLTVVCYTFDSKGLDPLHSQTTVRALAITAVIINFSFCDMSAFLWCLAVFLWNRAVTIQARL